MEKISKLTAYRNIQNQMGRAVAAFNFGQQKKFLNYFSDDPDTSIEYADEGRFVGKDALDEITAKLFADNNKTGYMLDLQLTTPIIEVAEDGHTAKCLWWCPGAGSILQKNSDPEPIWQWGEISVDFKLKNVWKIWHFHYFTLIKCNYHKGWVEDTSMINRPNTPYLKHAQAPTYHEPLFPNSCS